VRIILNADDFGQDEETVKATIECFMRGALTSATIMPKMPATELAIDFAKKHPEFSFGVHLTFVHGNGLEKPVSDPKNVSAFVDEKGMFAPSQHIRLLALRNKLPIDQIEREMTAQIAQLMDAGVAVSHVDSHGHLHKFKPFVTAMHRVLPKFHIKRVRTAQDLYIRKPLKSPTYWLGGFWRRRIMRRFITTDHLFMPTNIDDARAMQDWMPAMTDESIEVGGHPGYSEDWRNAERQALQSFATRATTAGHYLITWNQL